MPAETESPPGKSVVPWSEWRYNTFMRLYGASETWPRENKSIHHLPGPTAAKHMVKFDGYSYLQSIVSHLCKHRRNRVHVALSEKQMGTLKNLPWMDDYLEHLQKYNEKYGTRDKHPNTWQKIRMLTAHYATKPKKGDVTMVCDAAMLPEGTKDYEFDGRRFLDAVVNNWVKAFDINVKKIGVNLDDRQMNALMEIDWFYEHVHAILRRKGVVKHGEAIVLSGSKRKAKEEAPKKRRRREESDGEESEEASDDDWESASTTSLDRMIDKEKDKYKIIKDDTDDDDAIEDAETDYNSGPDFEQVEEEEEECIPFDEVNDVQKAQYRPDFSEMASGAALFQQLAAA
tara:strand:- start:31514 stop:32545 length:1032 start_codon:yes stop_codon:yes gene_type:complete